MLTGMLFQTVGAAIWNALEPIAVDANGWCRRSWSLERRALVGGHENESERQDKKGSKYELTCK